MEKKTKLFLEKLNEATISTQGFERGLYLLLAAFADDLPLINDYFHKAFRQIDVTNSGKVDMAIWQMLQESKIFWRVLESVQDEKTT